MIPSSKTYTIENGYAIFSKPPHHHHSSIMNTGRKPSAKLPP
jgi:hypothetical protein